MLSAKFVILLAAVTVCYGAPNAKFRNRHLKIDGVDAEIEDFPWVASVQFCPYKCEHICSAVIINKNWVLTGSKCIEYVPAYKVVAGTFYLNVDDKVTVDIEDAFIHPDAPVGEVGPNDLALLKLSQPLTFSEKLQPAKLPKQGQEFFGKANVSGFGDSNHPGFNSLRADLDTTIISNDECNTAIKRVSPDKDHILDDDSNVCTLSKTASTCDGDVGGPLSQDGTVIGTVAWYLEPCGVSGAPNVYNKLSNFVDWIERTITENS